MVDSKTMMSNESSVKPRTSLCHWVAGPRADAARHAFIAAVQWQWLRVSHHYIDPETGKFALEEGVNSVFMMHFTVRILGSMKADFAKPSVKLVEFVEAVLRDDFERYGIGVVLDELSAADRKHVLKFYKKT